MAAKPTVAELLSRIEVLEQRINVLEASASKPSPSTRTEKQSAVRRFVDEAELTARRASMAKAKAEALAGHHTTKVTW